MVPGGNGGGPGENRMMGATRANDLVDLDQNVVPTHTIHRQIVKLPRQMDETGPHGGTILRTNAEQEETMARTSRPPRPRRSLTILGWRRSADRHLRASRCPSATRGKATLGSPRPEMWCGRDGNTSTTLAEMIVGQSARRWAQEVVAEPPKGSRSRPSGDRG